MSDHYTPPDWLLRNGQSFTITAAAIAGRNGPWACPAQIAHDAHAKTGSVQPNTTSRWRKRWDTSEQVFFAVRDGLDALMGGESPLNAADINENLTTAQRRFVTHALHELLELPELTTADASRALRYQPDSSAFFRQNWGQVKLTGPEFASDDGSVREAVRLAYTPLREPAPGHLTDFAAVAAMVLSSAHPELARVRVTEFSLADGAYRLLFDGTPSEAQSFYASRSDPAQGHLVAQTLAQTELNPGSACGGCTFLQVCPGPERLPSSLGIDQAVATRGISGTDLSVYDECPTRFHAQRRSHLPVRYAEDGAGENFVPRNRGIAAHRFLAWAHARTPHQACTAADLPDPKHEPERTAQLLAAASIEREAYALARPYLLGHLRHCIVGFAGLDNIQVEPRHVIYDEYADVVLCIEPDLTLTSVPGSHIWRETKTRNAALPRDAQEAIDAYPTFAVHVAMLAAGAGGNSRDNGAAELEILTPDPAYSQLFIVDIADGALVAHAQKLVTSVLLRWSQDLTFEPNPSGACARCPMYGWCQPPDSRPTSPREPDDAEFLGIPDPF